MFNTSNSKQFKYLYFVLIAFVTLLPYRTWAHDHDKKYFWQYDHDNKHDLHDSDNNKHDDDDDDDDDDEHDSNCTKEHCKTDKCKHDNRHPCLIKTETPVCTPYIPKCTATYTTTPTPSKTPHVCNKTPTPTSTPIVVCSKTPYPTYTSTQTFTQTVTQTSTRTATITPTQTYTQTATLTPTIPQYDTPEPTPTQISPTAEPEVPREPCQLRVSRRGKGKGSRWNKEPSPFSNIKFVNNVYFSVDGKVVKIWHLDPCNRANRRNCKDNQSDPPNSYTYNGSTFTLIDPDNSLGGECSLKIGRLISPLVIDFKMDGIEFTNSQSARFNFGNGKKPTYWISNGNDVGFLAIDKNGNRRIDNINELFGDKTRYDDENKSFNNGFQALARYDSNGNGKIDEHDQNYKKLVIWFDRNSDGVTDHGELKRLSSMQIKAILLDYENIDEFQDQNGNISQQRAMVFLKGNPPSGVGIYDVYFANSSER